jgi:dihydrofolate reductase
MRQLVLQMGAISIDGYICEEGTEFWRSFGPFALPAAPDDDEFDDLYLSRLRRAGTHIMGRVTYLSMADT